MANISCVPFHFETRFTDSGPLVLGHIVPSERDDILSDCITKMKTETKVAIVIPNPSVHFAYENIMLNIFVWLCRKCECFDIVNESK